MAARAGHCRLADAADGPFTKPFGTEEFLARVRALLRRSIGSVDVAGSFTIGDIRVDSAARRVGRRGSQVRLAPKEFELFVYMAKRPNCVLTHRSLLAAVWGESARGRSELLRVFMGQRRRKLESDRSRPQYLITEPRVGYQFRARGRRSSQAL